MIGRKRREKRGWMDGRGEAERREEGGGMDDKEVEGRERRRMRQRRHWRATQVIV